MNTAIAEIVLRFEVRRVRGLQPLRPVLRNQVALPPVDFSYPKY